MSTTIPETNPTQEEDQPGFVSVVKESYNSLVNAVVRPMRAMYDVAELGPSKSMIQGVITHRTDLQLKNAAGYTLECSWWKPMDPSIPEGATQTAKPCIIFLHGNSSCRLGGLEVMCYAMAAGFSVFALDFAGSGLSEGKYVSLGYHEKQDIETVVKYLQSTGEVTRICLWGRSMGAVASILYMEDHQDDISAVVLDSPFANLPQLASELVADGKLGVPKLAVKLVMQLIRRDIKKRAHFDMYKLKPINHLDRCTIPAFFLRGTQDELVGAHHIEALHAKHNGPKQLFKFKGGHNTPRPTKSYTQALNFLRVMIGLLPLPTKESTEMDKVVAVEKSGRLIRKDPLPAGTSVEDVPNMSIKDLKNALARAGHADVSGIEKQELIDLVLKAHERAAKSSHVQSNTRQESEHSTLTDDESISK